MHIHSFPLERVFTEQHSCSGVNFVYLVSNLVPKIIQINCKFCKWCRSEESQGKWNGTSQVTCRIEWNWTSELSKKKKFTRAWMENYNWIWQSKFKSPDSMCFFGGSGGSGCDWATQTKSKRKISAYIKECYTKWLVQKEAAEFLLWKMNRILLGLRLDLTRYSFTI